MNQLFYQRTKHLFALAFIVLLTTGFASREGAFAPKSDLWKRWLAHDESNSQTIDHQAWGRLLRKYVRIDARGIARFSYQTVSRSDKSVLDGYVKTLASKPISKFNRIEQKAYWINLYNALTVKVVLDYFPVKSIRDINISSGFFSGLFSRGPWNKKLIAIEGNKVSLNDIEHRILRPIWRDNRIHYALNCASIGCPNLQKQVFTSKNVEKKLTVSARQFINNYRGVSVRDGKVTVSKIYDWFYEDFGSSQKSLIKHLARYANADLKKKLSKTTRIDDVQYDWKLNN